MAGSSLRLARSPVAPKIVSVVGWTGSRSRPSVSGLSAIRSLLHGVAAELRAQRREHLAGELAVAARVEAGVERGAEHRHGHVLGHAVLERPAALAGVRGVGIEVGEVVALLLEGQR